MKTFLPSLLLAALAVHNAMASSGVETDRSSSAASLQKRNANVPGSSVKSVLGSLKSIHWTTPKVGAAVGGSALTGFAAGYGVHKARTGSQASAPIYVKRALVDEEQADEMAMKRRVVISEIASAASASPKLALVSPKMSPATVSTAKWTGSKIATLAGTAAVSSAGLGYATSAVAHDLRRSRSKQGGMRKRELMNQPIKVHETQAQKQHDAGSGDMVQPAALLKRNAYAPGSSVKSAISSLKNIHWTTPKVGTAVGGAALAGFGAGYGVHKARTGSQANPPIVVQQRSLVDEIEAESVLLRKRAVISEIASASTGIASASPKGPGPAARWTTGKVATLASAAGLGSAGLGYMNGAIASTVRKGHAQQKQGVMRKRELTKHNKSPYDSPYKRSNVDDEDGGDTSTPYKRSVMIEPETAALESRAELSGDVIGKGVMVAGATSIAAAGWVTGKHIGNLNGKADVVTSSRGRMGGRYYRKRSIDELAGERVERRVEMTPKAAALAGAGATAAVGMVGMGGFQWGKASERAAQKASAAAVAPAVDPTDAATPALKKRMLLTPDGAKSFEKNAEAQ